MVKLKLDKSLDIGHAFGLILKSLRSLVSQGDFFGRA
jgi:hypothetical protein